MQTTFRTGKLPEWTCLEASFVAVPAGADVAGKVPCALAVGRRE
ncbi:hypothetical protein [Aureimonas glaciei]|nr:hypothetical protein [Aureimonas glaciei]